MLLAFLGHLVCFLEGKHHSALWVLGVEVLLGELSEWIFTARYRVAKSEL
jgi:hypothetical protein